VALTGDILTVRARRTIFLAGDSAWPSMADAEADLAASPPLAAGLPSARYFTSGSSP